MARQRKPKRETVALTNPLGTKVTVAKEKADHYKSLGYIAPTTRSAVKKSDDN
ncbi:MAG: hypothetical protein Q4F65_05675 [Propionibacteriaceae bacterium]|nr:hypothetical protein [Propionibacteriaceae bacterium]